MADVLNILPEAILYLASGFAFICGFYLLIDRRFDFFSEVSFIVVLVVGFGITNVVQFIPTSFTIYDKNLRNVLMILVSFVLGIIIAIFRNIIGPRITRFVIKFGRKKSSSSYFWYDRLDKKDRPVWLRLISLEKHYILEGVLISLSEDKENPYLLLGYYKKYDLNGNVIDNQFSNDKNVYVVVHPNDFDETILFYEENSLKCIELNIKDEKVQ